MLHSESRRERYVELDGVRGVAIGFTLLGNTLIVRDEGPREHAWAILGDFGWIGVQLFFVLSGYLITNILLDAKGERFYFRNFYARRALRIFPAYFLMLTIATVGRAALNSPLPHNPLCYWFFVSNFCIAKSGDWGNLYLGATWSLAVEEHFYLLWPLLIAFLSIRQVMWASVGIILGSLVLRYVMSAEGYSAVTLYTITPTRIDAIAAGALIAAFIRTGSKTKLAAVAPFILAGGLAVIAATISQTSGSFRYDLRLVETLGYTGLTLAAAGFILMLILSQGRDNAMRRAMRWSPLASIGFYSYAIYLYHGMVHVILLKLPLFQAANLAMFPGGPLAAQLLVTCAVTLISTGLAVASYHFFESRFLSLQRHFPLNSRH
ncbi:MAG: acyltransferase [Chitinophagales bacterium]|nr:acyltransferase [Hyphomicrobiales bacterium]